MLNNGNRTLAKKHCRIFSLFRLLIWLYVILITFSASRSSVEFSTAKLFKHSFHSFTAAFVALRCQQD